MHINYYLSIIISAVLWQSFVSFSIHTTMEGHHGANNYKKCKTATNPTKYSFFLCSQNFTKTRNKEKPRWLNAKQFGTAAVSNRTSGGNKEHLSFFEFLHVKVSKSAGEFVLVNVLVLRDVFVGAVRPRAARRPPEKTLLLVRAAKKTKQNKTGNTIYHFKTQF